jgi:BioD-like phosphotransacetylase family protein
MGGESGAVSVRIPGRVALVIIALVHLTIVLQASVAASVARTSVAGVVTNGCAVEMVKNAAAAETVRSFGEPAAVVAVVRLAHLAILHRIPCGVYCMLCVV